MIESACRADRISRIERERGRAAGTVESGDFGSPKIVGLHRPTQLHCFHHQRRKFRDSGADVETAAALLEFPPQHHGDSTAEIVAAPPFHSPELIASFITVNRSQCAIVETA